MKKSPAFFATRNTVTPAPLSITPNALSKTYGIGLTLNGSEFSATGLRNSETVGSVSLNSLGAAATAQVSGSPYTITASNATGGSFNAANYQISYLPASLIVSQAFLTPSLTGSVSKVYDANTTAPLTAANFTLTGILFTDQVTVSDSSASYDTKDVGTGKTVTVQGLTLGGAAAGNYRLSEVSMSGAIGSITPRALTISPVPNGLSKVYGDTYTFLGSEFSASGLQGGETIGSVVLSSPGALASAPVQGGIPYAISASGAQGGTFNSQNYSITYGQGALTVTRAPLSVTANHLTKTYGQTVVFSGTEFTSAGLKNGEGIQQVSLASSGAGATASVANGPYVITASNASGGTFNPANYNILYHHGLLTVDRTPITLTAPSFTKSYGQALAPSGTDFQVTGLQNGETIGSVTLSSTGFAPGASVAGHPYSVVASNPSGGSFNLSNYDVSFVSGQVQVNPVTIQVTANGGSSVYGSNPANPGITATGLVNGETVLVLSGLSNSFSITNESNAGAYDLSVIGTLSNSNYVISARNGGTWLVDPKPITVTAQGGHSIYGATPPQNPVFFVSGLVNGQNESVLTGLSTQLGITALSPAGTYTTRVVGALTNPNYSPTFVDGTWTVAPATLTYVADQAARHYGDANPTFAGTIIGLVNGEVLSNVTNGTAVWSSVAGPGSDTGRYAIDGSGLTANLNANGLTNYVFSQNAGNAIALTITPRPLTVTPDALTKVYGTNGSSLSPGTGFQATGLVNGDTLASVDLSSAGFAPTAVVGNYALNATGVNGEGSYRASNYSVTFAPGTLRVDPAMLTATLTRATKVYDATNVATFTPASFTLQGVVNNDAVAVRAANGTYAQRNVGTGLAVTTGGLSLTGANAGNYTISATPLSALIGAITPAPLTITPQNQSKGYGQLFGFNGTEFTATGLQGGETVARVALTSTGLAATASVFGGPYPITASGLSGGTADLSNYAISYASGSLTVLPAPLDITLLDQSKPFGQGPALSRPPVEATNRFTVDGLKNGNSLSTVEADSTGFWAASQPGTYAISLLTNNLTGGNGFDIRNYRVVQRGSATLTVTPNTAFATFQRQQNYQSFASTAASNPALAPIHQAILAKAAQTGQEPHEVLATVSSIVNHPTLTPRQKATVLKAYLGPTIGSSGGGLASNSSPRN